MTARRPYLVNVERRVCVPCRANAHEKCEPIAVTEKGLAEGTAYVECVCLCTPPARDLLDLDAVYDSERK